MKSVQVPNHVNVTTTRNYGDTAKAKSNCSNICRWPRFR